MEIIMTFRHHCELLSLFFCLVFASSASAASGNSPTPEEYADYERTLDETNRTLKTLHQTGASSCPSIDLVLSCGNGTCEADKKEDEITCPSDCNPARVRSY